MKSTFLLLLAVIFAYISVPVTSTNTFNCTNTTIYKLPEGSSPICDLCEVVVDVISFDVKVFNSSIALLEDIAEELCCLIGGPVIYNECKPIINDIKIIVDMIISGERPGKICSYLKFC